jgi:catechol 2,3-dioxygenase
MRDDAGMETNATRSASRSRTAQARLPDGLRMGPVRLVVTNLERAAGWYRDVVGLPGRSDEMLGDERLARLTTGDGTVVIELLERPDAIHPGRSTGLYHVALLYPSRDELAHALERIAAAATPIHGASDHGTHQAIYLPDPDGNGLELAADRPPEAWPNLRDIAALRPRPLDLRALLSSVEGAPRTPHAADDALRVGHVHLHVGDVERARTHYVDVLGFELVTQLDTAGFASAGGYHHHVAWNTWHGAGAVLPPTRSTGLAWWSIHLPRTDDVEQLRTRLTAAHVPYARGTDGALVVADPWGTTMRVFA